MNRSAGYLLCSASLVCLLSESQRQPCHLPRSVCGEFPFVCFVCWVYDFRFVFFIPFSPGSFSSTPYFRSFSSYAPSSTTNAHTLMAVANILLREFLATAIQSYLGRLGFPTLPCTVGGDGVFIRCTAHVHVTFCHRGGPRNAMHGRAWQVRGSRSGPRRGAVRFTFQSATTSCALL